MSIEEELVKFIIDQIWDDFFDEEIEYDTEKLGEVFSKEIVKLRNIKENVE